LLHLLKAYKPSALQSITVGVVGFPSTGQSSLINMIKRAKVSAVAAQPGHMKELHSVRLERGLRIVDSPGVIFEDDNSIQSQKELSVLLRNEVKPEDVDDPIFVDGCATSSLFLFAISSQDCYHSRRFLHGREPKDR
jgi:nuclear GTP-binding protein